MSCRILARYCQISWTWSYFSLTKVDCQPSRPVNSQRKLSFFYARKIIILLLWSCATPWAFAAAGHGGFVVYLKYFMATFARARTSQNRYSGAWCYASLPMAFLSLCDYSHGKPKKLDEVSNWGKKSMSYRRQLFGPSMAIFLSNKQLAIGIKHILDSRTLGSRPQAQNWEWKSYIYESINHY